MAVKLGDFVRFVDEPIEGYVTRLVDAQTVGVTDKSGFEIPVLAKKVVVVKSDPVTATLEEEDDIKIPTIEQDIVPEVVITRGIYWAVVTDAKHKELVHLKLLNETSLNLLVGVTTEKGKEFRGIYRGIVAPMSEQVITTLSLIDLSQWSSFWFQALFNTVANIPPQPPLQKKFSFKAKDFSGVQTNVGNGNKGWVFRIDEPEVEINPQLLKESFYKEKTLAVQIERPEKVIDLHIESICDNHHVMTNEQILNTQLNYFQQKVDGALVHSYKSIVLIHGVGKGLLKQEIYKSLNKNSQILSIKDADEFIYGFGGATEVFFK
jgi:hypothetical protein